MMVPDPNSSTQFVCVNIRTVQFWLFYSVRTMCDWLLLQHHIVVQGYLKKLVLPSDL